MKILFSIFFIFIFHSTQAQSVEKKNAINLSFGYKNSTGALGIYYNRGFFNDLLEVRLGIGERVSPELSSGLGIKILNYSKIQLFACADYSYNFPGKLTYDQSNRFYIDKYSFTKCDYLHVYLMSRFKYDSFTNFQLKLGYTFLLNDVKLTTASGSNENYSKAESWINSGILIAIEFGIPFGKKKAIKE